MNKNNKNLNNHIRTRIDDGLYNDLKRISKETDIKISTVVRIVLNHYAEKYKENNK